MDQLGLGRFLRDLNEKKADRKEVTRQLVAVKNAELELRATGVTDDVSLSIRIICALYQ